METDVTSIVDELAVAIAVVLALPLRTCEMVAHPTHGRCPPGWHLPEGIRTDDGWPGRPRGTYICKRPPLGGDDDVLTGRDTAIDQPGEIRRRIYCTNGQREIAGSDGRTVGCQARH